MVRGPRKRALPPRGQRKGGSERVGTTVRLSGARCVDGNLESLNVSGLARGVLR